MSRWVTNNNNFELYWSVAVSVLNYLFLTESARTPGKTIQAFEKTRKALRRRKQICFGLAIQVPPKNVLNSKSCRIAAECIDILANTSLILCDSAKDLWTNNYSSEIQELLQRDPENPSKLFVEQRDNEDFDVIFETLIGLFRLHCSEIARVILLEIIHAKSFFHILSILEIFRKMMRKLRHEIRKIQEIEVACWKKEKQGCSIKRKENDVNIGNMDKVAVALESLLEQIRKNEMRSDQLELSLRRILVMISEQLVTCPQISDKSEKVLLSLEEHSDAIPFEKRDDTDEDMVFEGFTLTEDEKNKNRSAICRDVLLDGIENRKHEASLMGELQQVLQPRRSDFEQREKAALAKFYGIKVDELEEKETQEIDYQGIGQGVEEPNETYDWRKEAEENIGIHTASGDDTFLQTLAARCVQQNTIE
ncbi:unnamed protein product [Caenorhabditis bovis]|uniref:Uncharacterized protein n=1 Tax=Caenorhabditis bovis TaxID=2654633 RepID=A0A8S1EZC6_9PELO|nr:unnamed protein product [Caenorhabditis bovis]